MIAAFAGLEKIMIIRKKIFIAAVAASIFMFRCGRNEPPAVSSHHVAVEMQAVRYEPVSIPIHAGGLLFSREQIRLSFKTGGIVAEIHAKEGQAVTEGDVLAQLDLQEISARVKQAESAYNKTKRDYDRVRSLYADSIATLEQMQNVETALHVAEANQQIARFNLEHSTIKAPMDGRILKRFIEEGEIVGPGMPVFYFGSGRQEWIVKVGVSERQLVNLNPGDTVEAVFDAYPATVFQGIVTELAQAADPKSGSFQVEIALKNTSLRLADGFVARVTIFPQVKKKNYLVPISALAFADGHEGAVFTVDADTAVKAPVRVGPIIGTDVVVLSGLAGVERVVTVGAANLKVGDHVVVH